MGHVWLARDERSGLDVALKIVPREGKSGHRAEREARAAASLRHPRCQRILSLARDTSHVYITYEYIPGRTLREAMRAGELDDRAAVEVAAQISEALAHAHAKGIVHRDVKPSNVLLAESAEIDVRLLDFGLAQMAEFDTLTALGDIPGTLAYISPGAPPGADRHDRRGRLGRRRPALGGARRRASVLGRRPRGDLAAGSSTGRTPLARLRPDLPEHVLDTVSSALTVTPQRRPAAERLAQELRSLPKRRRTKQGGAKPAAPPRSLGSVASDRLVPGAAHRPRRRLGGGDCPLLPGRLAARRSPGSEPSLGFAAPRVGLLYALTIAFFPLANISLGLALVYAVLAAAWLALSWRDARAGLLLALGPLLAPLAALAVLPLAAQFAHGRARRAAQAGCAVLLAALIAGLRRVSLPFDGSAPPLGLGIAGSGRPSAVAHALGAQLAAHPVLICEAIVLAAAAALLPMARGRGPWPAAFFGAALLAGTALLAPRCSRRSRSSRLPG